MSEQRNEESRPVEVEVQDRLGPDATPRARVLVVEDEHDLRDLMARWLEAKGYEAIEAVDGRHAVELLQAGVDPDVILLDLSMPRMDGWELMEWLRGEPEHRDRRVLVASAYGRELPERAADGTVVKPFPPEQLARELARLTSN
jgi:two-component system chemotaxis response regulator CheY